MRLSDQKLCDALPSFEKSSSFYSSFQKNKHMAIEDLVPAQVEREVVFLAQMVGEAYQGEEKASGLMVKYTNTYYKVSQSVSRESRKAHFISEYKRLEEMIRKNEVNSG